MGARFVLEKEQLRSGSYMDKMLLSFQLITGHSCCKLSLILIALVLQLNTAVANSTVHILQIQQRSKEFVGSLKKLLKIRNTGKFRGSYETHNSILCIVQNDHASSNLHCCHSRKTCPWLSLVDCMHFCYAQMQKDEDKLNGTDLQHYSVETVSKDCAEETRQISSGEELWMNRVWGSSKISKSYSTTITKQGVPHVFQAKQLKKNVTGDLADIRMATVPKMTVQWSAVEDQYELGAKNGCTSVIPQEKNISRSLQKSDRCRKKTACKGKISILTCSQGDAGPLKRANCGKVMAYEDEFSSHVHFKTCEKSFNCYKGFTLKTSSVKAMLVHTGERKFEHEQCIKNFTQKETLVSHMTVHTGERKFKCEQCGKSFAQKGNLVQHMAVHASQKKFRCVLCEMCFTRKRVLIRHMTVHTGEKKFKCEQCDRGFTRKESLAKHAVLHTGDRKFKCDQCGKGFSRNETLDKHLAAHKSDRKFKCEQCANCFTLKRDLMRHKTVHTGERKFKCEQCGKSFTQKGNLVRHMIVHTGERKFNCGQCGKGFKQKRSLVKHMIVHAGE